MRWLPIVAVLVLAACGGSGAAITSSKMTAEQVVTALQGAQIPIDKFQSYTAESDPNTLLGRPNQYTSKTNFHDTRLPFDAGYDTNAGGSVEVFGSDADAAARLKYIQGIVKSMPLLTEYDYQHGAILLRVAAKLTPDQAKGYEDALKAMK